MKKLLFATINTMLLIIFMITPVMAATTTQDGLNVTLSTDKTNYSNEDTINATVTVENQNSYAITGIEINSIIPKGYSLKDGELSQKSIESLNPGDKFELSVKYTPTLSDSKDDNSDESSDKKSENSTITSGSKDSNSDKSSVEKSEKNIVTDSKTQTHDGVKAPKSGDFTPILIYFILIIFSILCIVLAYKKRKKFNKTKMLALILCTATVLSIFPNTTKANDSNNRSKIMISETITINGEEAVLSASIEYDNKTSNPQTYTRAEWINLLVNTLGYNTESLDPTNSEMEYTFTDIEDNEFADLIQAACNYCILDTNISEFKPDDPATREFISYTAANALGCNSDDILSCSDSSSLVYINQDAIAVAFNIISLEDNYFYPSRPVSESEVNTALNAIKTILNSTETQDEHEYLEYKDGVIITENNNIISDDGTSIIINADTFNNNNIKIGTIIVDDNKAYKVTEVNESENGTICINYTTPELQEFLDSSDVAGELIPDFSQFVPADGVTVDTNSANDTSAISTYATNGTLNPDVAVNLTGTIASQKFPSAEYINGIDAKYKVSLKVKSISYGHDIDFKGLVPYVNNAYFKINTDSSASLSVGLKDPGNSHQVGKDWADAYIPLGTVPLIGTKCTGAALEIDLRVSITGEAKLVFNFKGDLGAQVYHNRPRAINTVDTTVSAGIAGGIKVGPRLEGLLELFNNKLISFSVDADAKAEGSVLVRVGGNLICADGNVGVVVGLDAFKETLIEKWLKISFHRDLIDHKLLEGHWENFEKVDKCTFGKEGILKGSVVDKLDPTKGIPNATIEILNGTTQEQIKKLNADGSGKYELNLPAGEYIVKISADGYINAESFEKVTPDETNYVETYLLVQGNYDPSDPDNPYNSNETGNLSGIIMNAVTGYGIDNAILKVKANWNNTTGTNIKEITTNADGYYFLELPAGYYTILCEKDGFVSSHFNISVSKGQNDKKDGSMTPNNGTDNIPAGQLRIVLEWGEYPYDIDSHLIYTDGEEQNYHIYYSNKDAYDINSEKLANLDRDDTDSYGPETTTIYKRPSTGKYSFYVRDYSNGENIGDPYLAASNAKVKLYSGDTLVATYNVPSDGIGNVWHVFDIDIATNKLSIINDMYGSYSDDLTPYTNENYENYMIMQTVTKEKNILE